MADTSVPAPYLGPNGFVIPSDAEILAGTQADVNAAFGGNLNPALNTPQGQLATSMAAITAVADQTFLYYTTQVDPAYATGRMQDAIARIYFIERLPALPTTVSCVCTGLPNTIISAGSYAQDLAGNVYSCVSGGAIGAGGTVTLSFTNNVTGPIPCPANSLVTIYQATTGWDTINNPADGVLGEDVESRQAFETRRAASVEQNSLGSLPSILGSVLSVPGVIDAFVTENATGSPVVSGNVTLAANSVYVAVVGGSSADVAQAIWAKKAPGCAYTGNTTVTVTDNNSGYNLPYPTYTVKYQVPSNLLIYFAVKLVNSTLIPSNATTLIQNALINAFSGGDGGPRARIGSNILASRFYPTIAALGSWAQIESFYLGSTNVSSAVVAATVSGTTLTVASVTSGALVIGQSVSDNSGRIIPGTTITAGSGSSWTLSNSMTIAGASFTGTGATTNLTVTAVTGTIYVGDTIAGTGVPAGTTIVSQTSGTTGGAGVYVTSGNTTSSGASLTSKPTVTAVTVNQFNVQSYIGQIPTIDALAIYVSTT